MKLSDIRNEQALDVLADIMEPTAEILADEEIKTIYRSGQPRLKLAAYVIKNHKKSVIEILARLDGEEPGTYNFSLLTLPKKVLELLNDPGLADLFTSQEQRTE